jgi:hypothetical protein
MIPTADPADHALPTPADDGRPRFFLDANYDASPDDGDWWLDLGRVDLPGPTTL